MNSSEKDSKVTKFDWFILAGSVLVFLLFSPVALVDLLNLNVNASTIAAPIMMVISLWVFISKFRKIWMAKKK
ncbi:MAG: hypothetical protein WD231_04435 [Candidatus Woykebacteria bacterium]